MNSAIKNQNFFDVGQAAEMIGVSQRHIRRACDAGDLPGAVREGSRWLVPSTSHPKLINLRTPDLKQLAGVAVHKREKAQRKLGLITALEEFSARFVGSGGNRKEAIATFASQNNVSTATLYRWLSEYKSGDAASLVDMRGGKTIESQFSRDAQELFKAMWLTQQRLSVRQCWQNVCYVNTSQNKGWQVPALRSMHNWIIKEIPKQSQILLREGKAAYDAKCAPFIETDPDSMAPGQWWTGDHHQCNVWVRYRDGWVRPWITGWMDMRSRCIVGRHVSTAPNQTTILLAMRQGIEKYGPPDAVKIDNGKDYDSQMFTGITKTQRRLAKGYIDENLTAGLYAMMGINVSFAIPYHPQAKPIERLFDTIDVQFCKTFKTYCGKDSARKPEELTGYLKTQKAIDESLSLEEFTEKFDQYMEVYNSSGHSGRGMDGRTPLEVISTRASRRVIDEAVLDMLLCVWSGRIKWGKNGAAFHHLHYGQFAESITEKMFGKDVRLAYDPADIRRVAVYDADTMTFIGIAEQNRLVKYGQPIAEEFTREASRKKASAAKTARAYRDNSHMAGMDMTELTLAAKMAATKKPPADSHQPSANLRPVRTALDTQIAAFVRESNQKKYKKAAGAESMSLSLDDMTPSEPRRKVKLDLLDD